MSQAQSKALEASRVDRGVVVGWCVAVWLGPGREEAGFGAYGGFPDRLQSGQREEEEGEERRDRQVGLDCQRGKEGKREAEWWASASSGMSRKGRGRNELMLCTYLYLENIFRWKKSYLNI